MRRSEGLTAAKLLLEDGKCNAEGVFEVEERMTCAFLAVIVLLTEPTRLVVRRDQGVGGNLKWHLLDLIDMMPFQWQHDDSTLKTKNTKQVADACVEQALVINRYRQIYARTATKTVLHLREEPTEVLMAIHETLARRIREAPLRLMFPSTRTSHSVAESLVRQCLLLTREQRRMLVQAVRLGDDSKCPVQVRQLVVEISRLNSSQLEELKLMLW